MIFLCPEIPKSFVLASLATAGRTAHPLTARDELPRHTAPLRWVVSRTKLTKRKLEGKGLARHETERWADLSLRDDDDEQKVLE
ncbi:hypothetical protein V496_05030 [Pseudogymnoascus sp. VKM F-4515 (FW-2607)]|nr:hypothetical protein V496_05030 [Pseudogymnoascus sp. VKM F-4515 (FW-2607)]